MIQLDDLEDSTLAAIGSLRQLHRACEELARAADRALETVQDYEAVLREALAEENAGEEWKLRTWRANP